MDFASLGVSDLSWVGWNQIGTGDNSLKKTIDEWGTEIATFISPKLWKEFFKPRYKKIFDACKKANWHIWMHSCGKVNEIIDDLIDIGVNVLNLQQPASIGIEEIGRRFAGRVCFASLCDIQRTLPFKGQKEIRDEAEKLLRLWGTPDGGFILSDYGDGAAEFNIYTAFTNQQ